MASKINIMKNPLQISAKIVKDNIYRGELPCIVKVTITNASKKPLLLNNRLAIGYRNSDSRELFGEVFKKGMDEIVSVEVEDYNRDSATAQNYSQLESGEEMTTSFDFCEWYELPLTLKGDFEMVIYYQADESDYEQPAGVLKGVFASERIPFKIIE
jgi:hypothetical protein